MTPDQTEATPCGLLHAMSVSWGQSRFMGGLHGVSMRDQSARREKFRVLQKWRAIWMERNGYGLGETHSSN